MRRFQIDASRAQHGFIKSTFSRDDKQLRENPDDIPFFRGPSNVIRAMTHGDLRILVPNHGTLNQ